jgi:hypothetical protein
MLLLSSACATTVSSECRQRMSDCIARCEAADPGMAPAKTNSSQTSLTECEAHCHCAGPTKGGNAPPMGKPTPTGTAPP